MGPTASSPGICGSTTTVGTPTGLRTATFAMRSRLELAPGQYVVVGNEEAHSAVAEVVRIEDNGVALMRVLPGSVDDNRALLDVLPTPH